MSVFCICSSHHSRFINMRTKYPLQLMDFAHRYTKGVLKDALVLQRLRWQWKFCRQWIRVEDIRLAIAARTQYQFKPTAPKGAHVTVSCGKKQEGITSSDGYVGCQASPEKYCLTAKEWDLEDPKSM
nr:BPK_HP1_G0044160.mRNA.1.CDS.1 [Saccharomyces cerevisiae]